MLTVCVCLQEERIRRGDDLRLQMALEESKKGGPDSVKLPKKKKEVKRTITVVTQLFCPETASSLSILFSCRTPSAASVAVMEALTGSRPASLLFIILPG